MICLPPLFRYFGSKWRLAPRYPLPTEKLIIEPFAGGAGYSLRYHSHDVLLVEKDDIVFKIWGWLLRATEDEIMSLPLIRPGESINDHDICQEAKWWIGYWNTISGARPQHRMVPSAVRIPSSFWGAHIRDRTAKTLCRIRHWRIIHGDYTSSPDVRATWFVDAPYQFCDNYGNARLDYNKLRHWCLRRKGQIIVCENHRANWMPFRSLGDFHSAPRAQHGGTPSRRTNEMVCHWDSDHLREIARRQRRVR
jgi:hypothetical protein